MEQGKITWEARSGKAWIFGEFMIEFSVKSFWPYSHVFTRENLYFDEVLWERGAFLFPLKEKEFDNTEIFLERDDIVVCCGVRWSFSGQEKIFVELVNLTSQSKYRFYPEEVSLIYHTKDTLICCYRDENTWKRSIFSLNDFSLISETSEHISAFFKLLYHHEKHIFLRLIYTGNEYFNEVAIQNNSTEILRPMYFTKNKFELTCNDKLNKKIDIDVWEVSLTWDI